MAQVPEAPAGDRLAWTRDGLLVAALGLSGLYLFRDFLIPLAFALLLVVLLSSLADWLRARRPFGRAVPAWAAHALSFAVLLLGGLAFTSIVGAQLSGLAAALPHYAVRLEQWASPGDAGWAGPVLAGLRDLLGRTDVAGLVLRLVQDATGLLLTLLYVPFLLLERHPMRAKIEAAAGPDGSGAKVIEVAARASASIKRYLGVKTFVSVLTALASYAVMKPLGLDFAETWAVLTFALNFIPSIGSVLAVALASAMAVVQFGEPAPVLVLLLGLGTVQMVLGNVVEPALMGRSLNLSPLMVILSLTAWTGIWGLPGALLSVPFTVCILLVLAELRGGRWIAVLLSMDGRV
ncbi:AI-2E family transporter [Rubellimicrobium roseum]|uniref:AI-2E family transporter n=1 Tax=Rubellimicrobium roseum TaxID=687525 RepID=A0A5C4NCT8_9RHOB|nr:AI-2E family transporter [Rubellimicrobium roseum]TNC65379.1 AI-2E family transporter [Rubellimicrobium roseum]